MLDFIDVDYCVTISTFLYSRNDIYDAGVSRVASTRRQRYQEEQSASTIRQTNGSERVAAPANLPSHHHRLLSGDGGFTSRSFDDAVTGRSGSANRSLVSRVTKPPANRQSDKM